MNISREEFESHLQEGQNLLLEILAQNPNVSAHKFYKVATFLEYLSLYSGVIYTHIETSNDKKLT